MTHEANAKNSTPIARDPSPVTRHPSPDIPHHPSAVTHHPSSTYRVQLNAGFTFEDARAIVPYLADLGVGTLYSSPFLRATPGSMHGYDVTDYAALNAEIGSEEDLGRLSAALRAQGMGLLVDVVPNHMGIAGGANAWWQDLLENGRTSPYADFFDIDWRPLKEELRGKILLPVLGDPYGVVLERGELRLALQAEDGAFTVHYYDTPFPIAPPTYPLILTMALDTLLPSPSALGEGPGVREQAEPLGVAELDPDLLEFQSIITAFERLPAQQETDPDLVAERRREQIVAKRRLVEVLARSPQIAAALEQAIAVINGDPEQPHSLDALDRLLDAQSYRLSSFRTAGEEINYRRFFAINELAAVRQEVPEVFQAAHTYLLRLISSGVVTGLRIDHPDGLWDPAGYFRDVQRAAWRALHADDARTAAAIDWAAIDPILAELWPGQAADGGEIADRLPLFMTVEKILEPGEALPHDWAVHGTVGYEFARVTTGLFIDGEQRRAFDQLYARFTQERRAFGLVAYDAKDMMLRTALASETNVLARALNRLSEENRRTRDLTLSTLRYALREVISGFPIYRTYIICNGRGVPERDRRAIERAVALAKRRNPGLDPSPFDFLQEVLLSEDVATVSSRGTRDLDSGSDAVADDRDSSLALGMTVGDNAGQEAQADIDARCHFVMKFQQLTGPVMAKGVEDTAFYIYNRLIALNEVGGDPGAFGSSVGEFHHQNAERARRWPDAMLTSSTHDTKRSEDVRARIAVLSEMPREWRAAVNRWARLNRRHRHKMRLEGQPAPDRNDEYLFYQTLLGAWPWGAEEVDDEFIARIAAFMIKAARESQRHTSWVNQDADYEQALTGFVHATLDRARRNPFLEDFAAIRDVVVHAGAINALAQQLLKLTAPGVPDVYQGTEIWDQSLVDPDNRRPVDYDLRARTSREILQRTPGPDLAAELLGAKADGRIKLYLTSRTLAYRQEHPRLFARGEYLPLAVEGTAAEHVVAFLRRDEEREIIVVVPRLVVGLIGKEPVYPIGEDVWGDTRLILPGVEPDMNWRGLFTGETLQARPTGDGASLVMGEVFAHLPFALVERALEDSPNTAH